MKERALWEWCLVAHREEKVKEVKVGTEKLKSDEPQH